MTRASSTTVGTITAAVLLGGLLGGCNLAPAVHRDALAVPAAVPANQTGVPASVTGAATSVAGPLADAAQLARTDWHAFVADPHLAATITLALDHNRDLRAALAAAAQAQALYRGARAALLPTVTASASRDTARGPLSGAYFNWNAGVSVSAWELDVFGGARNTARAARETALAADADRQTVTLSVIATTAEAWLTLAADRTAQALATATRTNRAAALDLARRQQAEGIGTALAVANAEAALAAADADAASYAAVVAQDRNALALVVGTPVPSADEPDTLTEVSPTLTVLPGGLPGTVLLARPDVRAAEHRLIAAHARIGAARAAFWPQISLTGLVGFASPQLASLLSGGRTTTAGALGAGQTLFDGGALAGNLGAVKAARDASLAAYDKTIQTAFAETANALARRETIGAELAAATREADATAAAAQLTTDRVAGGIAGRGEALDAEHTALAARLALARARLAQAANMVELFRALGGGLAAN